MTLRQGDSEMMVVRAKKDLRAAVERWRRNGLTVGFTPTMGALHAGHLSLVKKSREIADRTAASIFLNPMQFAPHEDYKSYPRSAERDLELLQETGCDLAYLPSAEEMYPPDFQTSVTVESISQGL